MRGHLLKKQGLIHEVWALPYRTGFLTHSTAGVQAVLSTMEAEQQPKAPLTRCTVTTKTVPGPHERSPENRITPN